MPAFEFALLKKGVFILPNPAILDNLVLIIENVTSTDMEQFNKGLERIDFSGNIEVNFYIGKQISQYHYNYHIGAFGEQGAIHIGWKHNNAKGIERNHDSQEMHKMRIEFNPSHQPPDRPIFDIFREIFLNHKKRIYYMDLAIDTETDLRTLNISSLTGKDRNIVHGTIYYGQRGKDGRLKVYDKKKEQSVKHKIKPENLPYEHWTRLEYTVKFEEGITIDNIINYKPKINQQYLITCPSDTKKLTAELRSYIQSIQDGYCELKEFSRTNRNKIKETLATFSTVDMDKRVVASLSDIQKQVFSYFQ
jgi:hypothetical protein